MVTLICPVRNCGEPLESARRMLVCENRHSFDMAGSGYVNLLQPQDRRSLHPGDTKEMALARRRFLDRGHGAPLAETLREFVVSLSASRPFSILDAGCGEGFYTAALSAAFPDADAWGVDISTPAIDAAARRYPNCHWVVANADRSLPFAAGSFDLVMSITARKNSSEFRRVIRPEGRLVVVVPGENDQIELREAVMGEGKIKGRREDTLALFSGEFTLEDERRLNYTVKLEGEALQDLFAMSYRGARKSAAEKLAALLSLEVTMDYRIFYLRPL